MEAILTLLCVVWVLSLNKIPTVWSLVDAGEIIKLMSIRLLHCTGKLLVEGIILKQGVIVIMIGIAWIFIWLLIITISLVSIFKVKILILISWHAHFSKILIFNVVHLLLCRWHWWTSLMRHTNYILIWIWIHPRQLLFVMMMLRWLNINIHCLLLKIVNRLLISMPHRLVLVQLLLL